VFYKYPLSRPPARQTDDLSATPADEQPTDRTWSRTESEAVFALLGDRIIDATRRWSRSNYRQRLQHDLYSVNETELTLAQVDALEFIERADIRMHELAEEMAIDPSTATRTVAPLVNLGLVDRQPDPHDRRYVNLHCTASGREVAKRITVGRRKMLRSVLESMEPSRRLLLADLLEEWQALTDEYGASKNQ
jgi:DNA-binding MarR family transcriptional regulator